MCSWSIKAIPCGLRRLFEWMVTQAVILTVLDWLSPATSMANKWISLSVKPAMARNRPSGENCASSVRPMLLTTFFTRSGIRHGSSARSAGKPVLAGAGSILDRIISVEGILEIQFRLRTRSMRLRRRVWAETFVNVWDLSYRGLAGFQKLKTSRLRR